jgi:hypothetical protein
MFVVCQAGLRNVNRFSMTSTAETYLSRSLRAVLDSVSVGADIQRAAHFQEFLSRLEFFLPAVLREIHPEWKYESLDGILTYKSRKTGEHEAELIGHCILITDQTTTPIHLRLQIAEQVDMVSWLELRLGERGESGMVRRPYANPPSLRRIAAAFEGQDTIEWIYHVTFGERRR